jgi:hypothetical protein
VAGHLVRGCAQQRGRAAVSEDLDAGSLLGLRLAAVHACAQHLPCAATTRDQWGAEKAGLAKHTSMQVQLQQ